jgi:hypothetical protein
MNPALPQKAHHGARIVLLRARLPSLINRAKGPQTAMRGGHRMKGLFAGAAIAAMLLASLPASAAEWNTILLEKVVNRTPEQTWARIGPYCAIAQWLKVTCAITSGNQVSAGTNRLLNGDNNEVMVASTPWSYTYAQASSPIFYHGTLAVEPMDRGRQTKIVYTLFYDIAPLKTKEERQADRERRTKRFSEALDNMKALAESE